MKIIKSASNREVGGEVISLFIDHSHDLARHKTFKFSKICGREKACRQNSAEQLKKGCRQRTKFDQKHSIRTALITGNLCN